MASRKPSVRHPNHSHPLSGHKALAEEGIICSGCDLDLIGAAFKCTKPECDYFLHKSCFSLPRETRHKAHPDHPLTLLYSSPYESLPYECSACAEYGTAFVYNCSICQFDLHVGCITMPESVEREGHEHPLTLMYGSPAPDGFTFSCDVCQEIFPDHLWCYYCEECVYGTHLHSCEVVEKEEPKRGEVAGGMASTSDYSVAMEMVAMLTVQKEMERIQMERRQMQRMQMQFDTQMQLADMGRRARKSTLDNI